MHIRPHNRWINVRLRLERYAWAPRRRIQNTYPGTIDSQTNVKNVAARDEIVFSRKEAFLSGNYYFASWRKHDTQYCVKHGGQFKNKITASDIPYSPKDQAEAPSNSAVAMMIFIDNC